MSSRRKQRRMARRRLGDMERYGLLALGAGIILGVGVLTEQLQRDVARRRAQEHPVAVTAGWNWDRVLPAEQETLASLEGPAPTPGGGEGHQPRRLAAAPDRSRHFDFFEPPVRLPGTDPVTVPPPGVVPTGGNVVTVRGGDTLQKIARRELGSSSEWPRFLQVNPGIDPRRLKEGQLLLVPDPSAGVAAPAGDPTGDAARTYVVRDRDTLEAISQRHYGTRTRWTDILEANRDKIPSPEKLRAGQRIRIPR